MKRNNISINRLLYILLTFALCTLFAACGDGDDPFTPEPPEPPIPPVEQKENIAFNIDGKVIRAGESVVGDTVFNINGNLIRAGNDRAGDVVFNFDQKYIYAGTAQTDTVFNFDGDYIRVGKDTTATKLFNMKYTSSNGDLHSGAIYTP